MYILYIIQRPYVAKYFQEFQYPLKQMSYVWCRKQDVSVQHYAPSVNKDNFSLTVKVMVEKVIDLGFIWNCIITGVYVINIAHLPLYFMFRKVKRRLKLTKDRETDKHLDMTKMICPDHSIGGFENYTFYIKENVYT